MAPFDNRLFNEPIIDKLTFYADRWDYRNKLFTFKVTNYVAAWKMLLFFIKNDNHIRSAYLKGYTRQGDEFTHFQQVANQELINLLNSGFNVPFPKFFILFNQG
jgi:hypothetical protein